MPPCGWGTEMRLVSRRGTEPRGPPPPGQKSGEACAPPHTHTHILRLALAVSPAGREATPHAREEPCPEVAALLWPPRPCLGMDSPCHRILSETEAQAPAQALVSPRRSRGRWLLARAGLSGQVRSLSPDRVLGAPDCQGPHSGLRSVSCSYSRPLPRWSPRCMGLLSNLGHGFSFPETVGHRWGCVGRRWTGLRVQAVGPSSTPALLTLAQFLITPAPNDSRFSQALDFPTLPLSLLGGGGERSGRDLTWDW